MKKHKGALLTETLRSIWQTRTRFLSILIIVALGCGFFAGLKASCPDMLLTADDYFNDTHLMDLHLMSTFGFNEDDLAAVREVDGIEGFQSIAADQKFYINAGGNPVVIFEKYEIAPGYMGQQEFEIPMPQG